MGERLASGAGRGRGRTRLTRALERGGYEPITDTYGTIRLRNCPFDALTESHRSLVCGTNLALANGLLTGAGATADLEPVLDPQPGYCCVAFVPAEARVARAEHGDARRE
jgi:predicted ArsR family transcriptional regulator